MKNLFKLLLCSIVAIATFACESVEEGNGLAKPVISCSVNENTITVTWGAVTGAAYYEIALDNEEAVKTDKLAHKFEGLKYDTEYTVKLQAISTDSSMNSKVATQKVTIGKRVVPAYREWYPRNNASATAISNNGRWVVGGYDHQGMIIDLNTDEVIEIENFEAMDVDDQGVAVGASFADGMDGEAAMCINGVVSKIDLSELTSSKMSCLMGITPDGEYVVGWWWEYNEEGYYGSNYGMIVPFAYDVLKDRVSVLALGSSPYPVQGLSTCGVAPDRRILGCEQSHTALSVIWADEYTGYEYPKFDYDGDYNPTLTFGDLQSRFSAEGKYVCGIAKSYVEYAGDVQQPAVYNCQTDDVYLMDGVGSATCVTDDGIAFLNDVPFYIGTTSYVVDLNGDLATQTPIIDWLLDEHSIDLYDYIKEGVITVGASADGRTLVGITNTESGWLTYVINLDGEAMPSL